MKFHPRNVAFFYITVEIIITTVSLDVGKIFVNNNANLKKDWTYSV